MSEPDSRCCGSGMCIIDNQGHCWCGQRWDGEKMCHPSTKGEEPASETQALKTPLPHSSFSPKTA